MWQSRLGQNHKLKVNYTLHKHIRLLDIEGITNMLFKDPEEFEEFLAPVGGDVLIRPATGSLFNADICMKKLDRVGLFTVSANSFKVTKEPQSDFYGLSIPLTTFTVTEGEQKQTYEAPSAHLLSPGRSFDLVAKNNCRFLVANFLTAPIHDYSQKLLQSSFHESSNNSNVSFFSKSGSNLLRSVASTWSILNKKTHVNEIAIKELEDDLLANFVLHSDVNAEKSYEHDSSSYLNRAVEYIYENLKNPITRDQLTDVTGRSIRTLSRAFEKEYGIGPMAFIKQRRLDSAYLDLLSTTPGTTSITEVALNYGFSHIGKFAIEYRKSFGESPSVTLLRQ
jgi:AraC-like DNA-binding protein